MSRAKRLCNSVVSKIRQRMAALARREVIKKTKRGGEPSLKQKGFASKYDAMGLDRMSQQSTGVGLYAFVAASHCAPLQAHKSRYMVPMGELPTAIQVASNGRVIRAARVDNNTGLSCFEVSWSSA